MAARIRPLSPAKIDEMRKRIKATLLLEKLQNHVFGEVELTQTQLKAAEVLLKKCMPDLAAVEHSGEVTSVNVRELSDAELAAIATGSGVGIAGSADSAVEPAPLH